LVDEDIVQAYYAQVAGSSFYTQQSLWIYPCTSTLPDFGMAIGPNYFAVAPGPDITFTSVGTTCIGGLQSNNGGDKQTYGDVMFKSQYIVHDGHAPALHIAPQNGSGLLNVGINLAGLNATIGA
jgi:hypothetical protein